MRRRQHVRAMPDENLLPGQRLRPSVVSRDRSGPGSTDRADRNSLWRRLDSWQRIESVAMAVPSPSSPALRCRGLVKQFGDVVAVAGLDLEVARGECFGLLG